MRIVMIPVALLAAGALLVGCSKSLDGASIEKQVADGMTSQAGGDWTVSCPSDITAEKGATFTCTATSASGTTSTINVTQDDADGNVTWTSDLTPLDLKKVETGVADSLGQQVGGTWTVTCPATVELGQGKSFTCDASSTDGQTTPIVVTQTDNEGNVDWTTGDDTGSS